MTHNSGSIQDLAQLLDMIQELETARLALLAQEKAMLEKTGIDLQQEFRHGASAFLDRMQSPAIEAWQQAVHDKIRCNSAKIDKVGAQIEKQTDVLAKAVGRADAIHKYLLHLQKEQGRSNAYPA